MTQTSQVDRDVLWPTLVFSFFSFTPGQYLCEICSCSRYHTQNYLAEAPGNTLPLQMGQEQMRGVI